MTKVSDKGSFEGEAMPLILLYLRLAAASSSAST
jgi:hypothetical protein